MIAEGIEPNPGPSWEELEDKLKERLRDDFQDLLKVLVPLKDKIKMRYSLPIVETNHILQYFGDKDAPVTSDEEKIANFLLETIKMIPEHQGTYFLPLRNDKYQFFSDIS